MITRRAFTKAAAAGVASTALTGLPRPSASTSAATAGPVAPGSAVTNPISRMGQSHLVRTDLLDIGYYEAGPAAGEVVLLYPGWPYSPDSYHQVMPELAGKGFHVYVPFLRATGPTTFRSRATFRSGQQAALGADVIAFMDALNIPRAIFGGYDWGGRALNVAAALWPQRCAGLVSVNSYLIQNLNLSAVLAPDAPGTESAHWYFYYFLTDRGAAALTNNAKELARVVWTRNSPLWQFTEADLDTAAATFTNPDYVAVVLNNYRIRSDAASGDPRYNRLEAQLRKQPPIAVPAVTLDGLADGSYPATDGSSSAVHFTGPRVHHQIPGAGHNLPQEAPDAFAAAIVEVAGLAQ